MTGPISYCGRYRVGEATIGDAHVVLSDLSHAEEAERVRLGIDLNPTYQEVADGRAFAVTTTKRPYTTLVIFGVSEDGAIWLLPSQHCVEKHGRMLGNKRICQWFIEHCFSLVPMAERLTNCVTPEGAEIINWLKKCAGARFADTPVPTKHTGALALPFIIERPSHL
jgi:hypothetical protein